MIKNRTNCIEHNEEIIYSTQNLDYFLTISPDTIYCYGNRKTDLSNFLIPGITSKISAESGEFLLNSDIFKNIIKLFNIEQDKTYFLLRIIDNSKLDDESREKFFLFADKNDCISFNSALIDISLKYKTDHLNLIKI